MLRILLVGMVLFIPNMRNIPFQPPIPGLNILNILFLLALASYYSVRSSLKDETVSAPIGKYVIFFWIASGIALINGMVRGDVPASIDDVIFYKNHVFYMGLYFLYFYAVRDRKTLDQVYWALIFVTAVAGLQAVRQALSIGASGYSVGARVSGPFGSGWENANMAGVFYAQYAPVIFAELIYQRDIRLRILLIVGLAFTVMGLFYTYSRKSYYALAAALSLIGATTSKYALILIFVVLATFPAWAPESAVQRIFGNEEEQFQGNVNDESTESRFILWEGAMRMYDDNPMGVGLERFKHHIGNYSTYSKLDAHNYYVLVLAEMGPLGEFTYLLMIFMMYREGSKLASVARSPREKALAAGFRGAMLAFIMANTFGSAFNFGTMMGNMWVLTALVSRMRVLIEAEAREAASSAQSAAQLVGVR